MTPPPITRRRIREAVEPMDFAAPGYRRAIADRIADQLGIPADPVKTLGELMAERCVFSTCSGIVLRNVSGAGLSVPGDARMAECIRIYIASHADALAKEVRERTIEECAARMAGIPGWDGAAAMIREMKGKE